MQLMENARFWFRRSGDFAATAVCAAMLSCGTIAYSAEGAKDDAKTVEGRVKNLTKAPKGEVDGAELDDGTILHWPPDMQDRFSRIANEGDRVRASGRMESPPRGEKRFEVEKLTNLKSNQSAVNPDFADGPPKPGPRPGGPKPPPRPRRGETETLKGKIEKLTTAPEGETDGAILDDGTNLHWPPHLQERFAAGLKVGDRISATGAHETGPRGDKLFEIKSITNNRTSETIENSAFDESPERDGPRGGPTAALERRIDDLQRQIDDLQREVKRLRDAK